MFDIDHLVGLNKDVPIFYNAAVQLARHYDLRIQVYAANRVGKITFKGGPKGLIGEGNHLVEIAQFGETHFELIDNDVPIVCVPINTGEYIYIFLT